MNEIMSPAARRHLRARSVLVSRARRAFRHWQPIACAFLADRAFGH
jgi:hypothetical protein